nr:DNA-directed RNA polymerases IV and V subunit 4-like [Tanacetum cinerariifolium]
MSDKSAFKSPASKGKDGRKVQFDSDDLFDEKFETNGNGKSNGKSSSSKGGKGDKGGASKKEPPPLMLKVEQELPENAKCLMDCEAAQILQGIQDHMVLLSKDPSIKIPSAFDRALQYASRGNHYTDPHSLRQVLEPLKIHGVSDGEMCVIANTAIETVGEAFGLMPSLKANKSKLKEPLKAVVAELQKEDSNNAALKFLGSTKMRKASKKHHLAFVCSCFRVETGREGLPITFFKGWFFVHLLIWSKEIIGDCVSCVVDEVLAVGASCSMEVDKGVPIGS